jgi:aspartate aminotransferase
MLELLADIPGIGCTPPEGAFYVFASIGDLLGKATPQGARLNSEADFVEYLLREAGVAVVGGSAYGMSPYIRLSFASAMEVIEEGAARLARACAALR